MILPQGSNGILGDLTTGNSPWRDPLSIKDPFLLAVIQCPTSSTNHNMTPAVIGAASSVVENTSSIMPSKKTSERAVDPSREAFWEKNT